MRFEDELWSLKEKINNIFQFSLWDSYRKGDGTVHKDTLSILFMRFWGSLMASSNDWEGSLSILFMRFSHLLPWRGSFCILFQFSLWDSGRRAFHKMEYEVFQFSLWDSLNDAEEIDFDVENFQFSLWDSWIKWN